MPSGFTGLDPALVRGLAGVMRGAVDAWRRLEQQLVTAAARADLTAEAAAPSGELAAAAGAYERAAVDLDARAALAEAIDRGDWSVIDELAAEVVRTERAWERATSGGPDEGPWSTWTHTRWDDLEQRMLAVVDPVPSALCAEDAWYREAGTVVGPDGQAYPILVPNVRNPDASDEGDTFIFNDDWGRTDDAGVATLLGADPGWATVAVETGSGRLGQDPGAVAAFLIGAAGSAGARHLDTTGLRPVPLEVYQHVGLDASWVPDHVPYADGAVVDVPDVPDEAASGTPSLVVTAGGHVRYESTVAASARAVLATGAADLIGHIATGTGNVRTVQDRRNIGYAVEYQVNDDGRTRAVMRGYQLAVDDDGEIRVSMGHLGVTEHGPGPVSATAPRISGGYTPTFDTNGVRRDD